MFCDRCQTFWRDATGRAEVPTAIKSCEDVRWTHYETVLHRSMRELKSASDQNCTICRIIFFTPTTWERDSLLGDENEALEIVLDIDPRQGPHPVLSATFFEATKEGKERAARVPKRMLATCAGLLADGELASTLERIEQCQNDSTGSDAALELASFWQKRCVLTHDKCRPPKPSNGLDFVPTRLLDVANNAIRLIETKKEIVGADADRKYVALSHCWGKVKIIRTLKDNYDSHLKDIPSAALSQTFKDAVHATRKLGFRYLWIDSLCIKQDDGADWQTEAATMCDVYRNAALTIAAAHAADGAVGCFEKRDGILQLPFVVEISQPATATTPSSTKNPCIMFTSYGRGQGLNGPEPPLYGRAWVLQEQLLSPCMLIFDGPQIRWQCLCMHGSERTPVGGMSRHIGYQGAIRSGIMDEDEFFDPPTVDDKDFAARMQHQNWCYLVMEYTHRGMTAKSDRLVALEGIAQALSRHTKQKYYAGLWDGHFWVGLLWSISHMQEYTTTTMNAFDLDENKTIRCEKKLAPSWSWVSVTVPVVYAIPDVIFVQRICEVLNISIMGSPPAQMGKTQIRGHVRTGYVNSIYPYAIREAAQKVPKMTSVKSNGSNEPFTYNGRSFSPGNYFLYSHSKPSILHTNWRLVRGTWRPDEILDPSTPITFLAIAQRNTGSAEGTLVRRHEENDPLEVYAIGLVPTGKSNDEYRRVGYGVWEQCAWYGYMCGRKDRGGREVQWAKGWSGLVAGRDLEKPYGVDRSEDKKPSSKAKQPHRHKYRPDQLPDEDLYDPAVRMQEKVITIV